MRARIRERENERERERLCGLSLSIFLFWRDFETSLFLWLSSFFLLNLGFCCLALGKKGENETNARDKKKKNHLTTSTRIIIYTFWGGHAFRFLSSLNVVGVVVDRLRTTTEW